jgi:GTP 3',8-cyclase
VEFSKVEFPQHKMAVVYVNKFGNLLKPLGMQVLYILAIVRHPLTSVAIEINSHCNRKCDYCPNKTYQREISFLDERLVYKIIDELKEKHFKGRLTFNGFNEPLLDERLTSFIEYARKHLPDVYIYLNTNGDFLNYPLWKNLRSAGLDYAKVSQYEGHVNSNIQNLLSILDEKEMKHMYISVFDASTAHNRAGLVKLENSNEVPLKEICIKPFYQLRINYQGKAILCCNDYFGAIEMGDIYSQNIFDIWKSKKFQDYRRRLFFKDRAALILCKSCNLRQIFPDPQIKMSSFLS